MGLVRRKRIEDSEDEIAFERVNDSRKIKKLDKIYIIIACVLATGWLVWSLSGLKQSPVKFGFISDAYSNWNEARTQTSLKTGPVSDAALYRGYLYYYDSEIYGICRIKTDGTQNERVLKDNALSFNVSDGDIYFTDLNGSLMEETPGGKPVLIKAYAITNAFERDGNYIYYLTGNGSNSTINRIGINGSGDESIVNDGSREFVPYGNYIYYITANGEKIERVGKSGGEAKVLLKATQGENYQELGIYKQWIYFLKNKELYKCSLDGSKKIKLQSNIIYYSIENDILYISTPADSDKSNTYSFNLSTELYSMNLDGKDKKLIDKENKYSAYFKNGIVISYDSSNQPFLKNINTGQIVKITKPALQFAAGDLKDKIGEADSTVKIPGTSPDNTQIIKNNNCVYYFEHDQNGIFKLNEEDGKNTEIADDKIDELDGMGNLLFFTDVDPKTNISYLYCMNFEGKDREKVFDFPVTSFQVEKDGIYFLSNEEHLYKANFDDNKIVEITNDTVQLFKVYNGYIYIYNSLLNSSDNNGELYRIKEDGTSRENILEAKIFNFKVSNGYVFYYDVAANAKRGIYRIKIGDKTSDFITASTPEFTVDNKYLYIQDISNAITYRSDLNGNNRLELSNSFFNMFIDGENIFLDDDTKLIETNIASIEVHNNPQK